MSKSYSVVEVFRTLQGEGFHAGRASIFVRFTGCNLWTGHDQHRERDAQAHEAKCPRWCDTDFRKGKTYSAFSLAEAVRDAMEHANIRHIVFTGGEPFLQLDGDVISVVRKVAPFATIAVETNGTVEPKHSVDVDWVCVSPKVPFELLKIQKADELKIVVPDYDPLAFDGFTAAHYFVSPRANALPGAVGRSLVDGLNVVNAAKFAMVHPRWRLSMQTHKLAGIP